MIKINTQANNEMEALARDIATIFSQYDGVSNLYAVTKNHAGNYFVVVNKSTNKKFSVGVFENTD